MLEFILILKNVATLSIISIIIAMIIDKEKLYKRYAITFITILPVASALNKTAMPELAGVAIPVIIGIMVYITYKKLAYAEYIAYVVYISIILGDLIVGLIYTNILKINLYEYFKNERNTLIYMIFTLIASVCIGLLNKYIAEKKIKLKDVDISREAKIILSICVTIALIVQMLIAHRTQSTGIQADIVMESLFLNTTIVIIFMYTIFYSIQYAVKVEIVDKDEAYASEKMRKSFEKIINSKKQAEKNE